MLSMLCQDHRIEAGPAGALSPVPGVFLERADSHEDADLAVSFDGSIYNARELWEEVGGVPGSPAELLGRLYLRLGAEFVARVNGPCAVGIFDKRSGRLTVATDRYGIRPVFYLAAAGRLICAGRIRDILAVPGSDPGGIDPGAVVDYLNLSAVPGPRTVYRNLRKLPPGHLLTASLDNLTPRLDRYYDLAYRTGSLAVSEILAEIPRGVERSVATILESEAAAGRSVGSFLSGGTDSSTVTGMMARLSGAVRSFSIGFDEAGYNELDYARLAARRFGAEHHEYMVTPADVLAAVKELTEVYDEPFGNASAIPTYFCARLARGMGVDTLLAGDGGDEIFGGNERYAAGNVFSRYQSVPALLRKGLIEPFFAAVPAVHPVVEKGRKYLRRANLPQPERFFSYHPVAALGMERIFSPDFLAGAPGHDPDAWARELWRGAGSEVELNRQLYLDMKFTITDNDLRKVTGMTEHAGVRAAYPLLDHRLVDFAAGIPPELKVKGKTLRYAFKKSLEGFLPDEILAKQKHGFGLPIGVWIRTKKEIAEFVGDTLLCASCGIRSWLRAGFLEELFGLHRETGAPFYGDVIWHLLALELWHREALAPRTAAAAQVMEKRSAVI